VYAPTSTAPDEEIEQLYEDISTALRSESTYFKIITGDFNAKLGITRDARGQRLGRFGTGTRNTRGDALINFLQSENLFCMNSFFQKPENRRWTWRSPDSTYKNEIDFTLSNKKYIVKDVTVLNQFDTDSDHRLVRAKIQINTRAERNKLTRKIRFPTLNELKQNETEYKKELE